MISTITIKAILFLLLEHALAAVLKTPPVCGIDGLVSVSLFVHVFSLDISSPPSPTPLPNPHNIAVPITQRARASGATRAGHVRLHSNAWASTALRTPAAWATGPPASFTQQSLLSILIPLIHASPWLENESAAHLTPFLIRTPTITQALVSHIPVRTPPTVQDGRAQILGQHPVSVTPT